MEIWIFFLVFIVAGLGLLAMLGYVKNETDRLELKHFMATAEFKREMVEVQAQHAIKVEQDRAQRYIDAIQSDNVLSVGRLGNYRYMDIGNVTLEALEKVSQL